MSFCIQMSQPKLVKIIINGHMETISICDFTDEWTILSTLREYFMISDPIDSLFFYTADGSSLVVFPPIIPPDLHLRLGVYDPTLIYHPPTSPNPPAASAPSAPPRG
jgi:hypothetical protein